MGRLADQLRDPWGPLVAGVVGGLSWAVGTPVLAAVGVGAVVYGVKAALGAVLEQDEDEGGGPAPPRPHPGSAAALWLRRAESAVRALDDMADAHGASAADVATERAAGEADQVLATMRHLGGHVVAVGQALARSDAPGLDDEAARLRAAAAARPGDPSAQRSAAAVADRVAVRDRLRAAQADLEGRLQSSALGLEGLVARVAEVRAGAATLGDVDATADSLASLTTEVEGLRLALSDVDDVARRALGEQV
ncbi:MAG TPA: hypothetical protein VMZ11_07395 [Mycobacteriales bacterium]|nr:hypothetical protein [Mycobacteriales bacterium]